ncbi:uncharacterized protein P174DRAFT_463277 [Aspergillus novofumigatus IBT 16806]|uniref:C2H2-type domain-containing protein n=1 Tax=Aspergillus novofumigatus (strain IBT 16806) TaxID=1392255 RepID=A0A2I1C0J6_ASPN1|nr:uncharacterized protein P174DRAFT_463277 [Aspergillus novofumigatus IBT 16806]PKX91139.1 hypothetical protein P174DRAFT_463277 [Aspergillus novofumigatus IBT 16806]
MTFQCGWLQIQLLLFYQLATITICDPDRGQFTKTFLGEKEQNTFPIPEIIFDPTLVLSPYVFLLGMLFRIKVFKNFSKDRLVVDCPKNLYNLRGEITGFKQVTKLYYLYYRVVKAFNDSSLKHASINTFIKYYSMGIHINAQAIFIVSMSWLINPHQPYKLEDTSVVNKVLSMCKLQKKEKMKWAFKMAEWDFQQKFMRENLVWYKNKQPVINMVDEEVIGALEWTGYITLQYMILINTVLTMPGSTITIINTVIAYYSMEEDNLPSAPPAKSVILSICIKAPHKQSLGCHFVDIHVIPYPKDMRVKCSICREELESKLALINHAETVHGTIL